MVEECLNPWKLKLGFYEYRSPANEYMTYLQLKSHFVVLHSYIEYMTDDSYFFPEFVGSVYHALVFMNGEYFYIIINDCAAGLYKDVKYFEYNTNYSLYDLIYKKSAQWKCFYEYPQLEIAYGIMNSKHVNIMKGIYHIVNIELINAIERKLQKIERLKNDTILNYITEEYKDAT